ncbi:uncharacterized protein LOC127666649 [Apodemus sylvaticus]|uniref:uncharacterized protein LOC127666649 n=1 Tax=Apodemus sylvaticus TaxID=10129 RepID=UPI0022431A6E|nr:uncharacterized protein LOC127666649 [Apodemus sylvaticus]
MASIWNCQSSKVEEIKGSFAEVSMLAATSLRLQWCSKRGSRTCPLSSLDKAKKMMWSCPSFVKGTLDSAEHALPSTHVLPALSTRYSKSEPFFFCGELSHYSDDGWVAYWDLYTFYVFESLKNLRHYHRLNCAKKKGKDVSQSESSKKSQASPRDMDNNKEKGIEEPDQPSPSLLRENGLELETYDGGDCPDQDPASDSPTCPGCWAWLQRALGEKKEEEEPCPAPTSVDKQTGGLWTCPGLQDSPKTRGVRVNQAGSSCDFPVGQVYSWALGRRHPRTSQRDGEDKLRQKGLGALVCADPENLRRTEAAAMEIRVCIEFAVFQEWCGRGVASLGILPSLKTSLKDGRRHEETSGG